MEYVYWIECAEQKVFQDKGEVIMENKLTYKILTASDYDELYAAIEAALS